MPTLTDPTQCKPLTLAAGDIELWRVKDGRFLIHLAFRGQRNMWIELSRQQADWLAGELSK